MQRWTLLAAVCTSVLQVSIANVPLIGGDDEDDLRSPSISKALEVPGYAHTHDPDKHMPFGATLAPLVSSYRCENASVRWQLWDLQRCASCNSEFAFPIALTNRQYWTTDTWAYCSQYAVTKFSDSLSSDEFRAFCPRNVSSAYLRGMFIFVHSRGVERWLPAEFLIPCNYTDKPTNDTTPPRRWNTKNRLASLVHVTQRFQTNLVEGSHAPCKDQFGNAHVTPQDVLPACQYGTHVAAAGVSEVIHFMWTNNNYADLMEMFDKDLKASTPAADTNGTAVWRPVVDITERKDQCKLKYGYVLESSEDGNYHFQFYYGAECACSDQLDRCNPVQEHPYEGMCPMAATIYMRNNETALDIESLRDAEVFTDNPFDDFCNASMLFRTYADDRFELQIELGGLCPPSRLDAAENGCNQFVQDCYGIQPKHVAIACCNTTFCDPDEDPSCDNITYGAQYASGALMAQINSYLWDPADLSKDPRRLSTKVANQINYCAYHSNVWSEGYSQERPEYCYVFVDLKWRQFVNISAGWNFDFSRDEHLSFPPGKNCTIVHGTVRAYCPSVSHCINEVRALKRNVCPPMENDKQHTVVACRCSTLENRTYYCDENITATDVLNWVEKPQCFNGTVPYRASGRYNSSELTRLQSSDLNVRCYWYDYQEDNGRKWREYGFYKPDDARFVGYDSLNCFPADCTPNKTLPHFCCCRTSRNGAESVCNNPESNLEQEVQVWHDRRDPDGISMNVVERNWCEGRPSEHQVNVTGPRELVAGLPVRDMCYYKLELVHRKNSEGQPKAKVTR
ncbi:hypothetical protein AAVH_37361, partial [Aphelenchoides avenae]